MASRRFLIEKTCSSSLTHSAVVSLGSGGLALLPVVRAHDVRVDGVVGGVRGGPGDDGSFIEGPLAPIVFAAAAVAAAAEHDGALLLHGVLPRGKRTLVIRVQRGSRR